MTRAPSPRTVTVISLLALTLLLALALSGCIGAGMMANGFKKEPCPNNQPCERTK